MRKIIVTASSLALIIGTGTTAPAFAELPPFVDPNPELSSHCVLKPNPESGFEAVAINVSTSGGGAPVTVDVPGGTVTVTPDGVGTPTTTITGPAHRHGQSPNIFGFITTVIHYNSSTRHIPTMTTTPGQTTSFDCHVHKYTGGTVQDDDPLHPGYKIAPAGLQSDAQQIHADPVITYGERTEQGGPIDVTTQNLEDGVICISPGTSKGSLGGTWRNQNGYNGSLGTCSTTFFYSLPAPVQTDPIPSQSLPPA
jgi:hypothetical protein